MRSRIDATILRRDVTLFEVKEFAKKVSEARFRSLVTYPFLFPYLKDVVRVKRVGVVDFPYGTSPLRIKVEETKFCEELGLDEIDYVVNLSAFKSFPGYAREEALKIASSFSGTVKAILEVPLLSREEVSRLVNELRGTGVRFLKTSTGLYRPVTVDDVRLLKELAGSEFLIKASGGIRAREQAQALINAGADVLGTSRPFLLI